MNKEVIGMTDVTNKRCCQTNSNSSQEGQGRGPLRRAEIAPLGKSEDAVSLEI